MHQCTLYSTTDSFFNIDILNTLSLDFKTRDVLFFVHFAGPFAPPIFNPVYAHVNRKLTVSVA